MEIMVTAAYALFLAAGTELSEAIGRHELEAHVYKLASPEFAGRRGAGGARTARYIEATFRSLGLKPAFGNSFEQPIPSLLQSPSDKGASFLGHNVGAILPGSDPELSKEWVILNAHYDHLGRSGIDYYPGADDACRVAWPCCSRLPRLSHSQAEGPSGRCCSSRSTWKRKWIARLDAAHKSSIRPWTFVSAKQA